MGGPVPERYGGKATLASLGAQGYQHWNEDRMVNTYIFMFMISLSPCSLAVMFSKGFRLHQRRLGSYSASCKLEVKKKVNESFNKIINVVYIAWCRQVIILRPVSSIIILIHCLPSTMDLACFGCLTALSRCSFFSPWDK
jgi:hypothetical protein